MNYEGTQLEAPKFGLSFFAYDYADSHQDQSFRNHSENRLLIKELDKL